ncbi:MAG: MFS transporter [Phycisphaerae bacterium]
MRGVTQQDSLSLMGDNVAHARRNHRLGLASGTFAGMAQDFLNPEIILVGLITALTDSAWLVALIVIINKAAGLGPQLLISSLVEHQPRRRPYFVIATIVRGTALSVLVLSIYLLSKSVNAATLALFYLAYLVQCVCTGSGHILFMDMVGRLIPADRVGTFLGMRTFLGGGLGILAGFVIIQPMLERLEVPTNYLLVAAIGTILVIIDMSLWSHTREEPGAKADRKTTFTESLRRGWAWMKADHNYRCYFYMRVAFRLNYLGLVFFIPFGKRQLTMATGLADVALLGGIMVATLKGSRVVAGAIWGKVTDRFGSKATLIGAGVLFLLAPPLALVSPLLPELFILRFPALEATLNFPLCVYLLALACVGGAIQGNTIGGHRFLVTNAPPHRRASYVAFLNTITSPLTLLPLAGAWMAESVGMNWLFICITAGGLMALVPALRMHPEPSRAPSYR